MTADPLSQALDPWGFESPFGASASGERTTAAGQPAVVGAPWGEAPWVEAPWAEAAWTEAPWTGEAESAGGVAFPSGAVLARASGATGRDEEHWDPNGAGLPLLDTRPALRTTRLSPNFTVGELASSGGRASDVARISPELVRVLQAIRDRAGKAVRITSGYRSWARNKALYQGYGKKPTLSRHCSGQAADITVPGLSGAQIAKLAIDAAGPELAIGIGTTFAHVDVRGAWALWSYGGVAASTVRAVRAYRDARRRGAPPAPVPPGPVPPGPVPPPVPRVPGQTAGGRLEVARVPLLAAHRGAGPDLVLRWNGMQNPEAIDVVVHLHGYSPPAASMRLPRDKEPISGLDFSDPAGREPGGRTRPTLALLPGGSRRRARSGPTGSRSRR
ncbi:YcbK family protein [Sinomonas flava]|uniref:YcbK family protein n=1 Tax=Sinomonas flava TaxID=496857 RepID=UPI0039A5FFA3